MFRWHSTEDNDTSLQAIQAAIIATAGKRASEVVFDHFLEHALQLRWNAMLYLLAVAKSKRAVVPRLRAACEQRRFDLDVLSMLAIEHPARYNLLLGGGQFLDGPPMRQDRAYPASMARYGVSPSGVRPLLRPQRVERCCDGYRTRSTHRGRRLLARAPRSNRTNPTRPRVRRSRAPRHPRA